MMITLELEKIGGSKPWVARITGTDPKFGLARTFVNGIADYSRSNRPGTRGIYHAFDLDEGIYEVKGGSSWGSAGRRSFVRVHGDVSEEITMAEVLEAVRGEKVGAA
jgi:hypothetical protein